MHRNTPEEFQCCNHSLNPSDFMAPKSVQIQKSGAAQQKTGVPSHDTPVVLAEHYITSVRKLLVDERREVHLARDRVGFGEGVGDLLLGLDDLVVEDGRLLDRPGPGDA